MMTWKERERRQHFPFPFDSSSFTSKPKVENAGRMYALSKSKGKTVEMDCTAFPLLQ